MLTRYTKVDETTHRGLGWAIKSSPQGDRICHGGSNGTGFRCWSELYPDRRSGIVIMTSSTTGAKLHEKVMEEVRGQFMAPAPARDR